MTHEAEMLRLELGGVSPEGRGVYRWTRVSFPLHSSLRPENMLCSFMEYIIGFLSKLG